MIVATSSKQRWKNHENLWFPNGTMIYQWYIFNIRVSLLAVRAYCRYMGTMLMVLLYLILHDRHVC